MRLFTETLYDSYGQQFKVDRVYFKETTHHQDLIIFHNAAYGRVMALDGIVQTTERDEFIYHEMLAHVPILAHGHVRSVLILGGGDGGILREVIRYPYIEGVTQVEIDQAVIDLCKVHLPTHSSGAYEDPRVRIVIDDGAGYVARCTEQYDLIISDSTDPIGPGETLFTYEFYKNCARLLGDAGILVTQNGVVFEQMDEAVRSGRNFQSLFNDWHFYNAAVPTYVGGIMVFGFASQNPEYRQRSLDFIQSGFKAAKIKTRYYNPAIHRASFALPQYVLEAIGKGDE